jgi:hypothetical protein
MWRGQYREGRNPVGVLGRHVPGDDAAPVVADEVDLRDSGGVGNGEDVGGQFLDAVRRDPGGLPERP